MAGDMDRWLESVGLAKYAGLFSENGIDFDIVGELEDADLKDLGIALGDRKRLLKAIATISTDRPAAPTPQPASSEPAPAPEAQRRQLTVMFCDLVGSTALSRRLDPEDLREAVQSYQRLCAGIIARIDGFVAQYLGDGILVYFGWPQAHENDAERAVRAALGIVEAMQGAEAPKAGGEALSVRIGIATGPVVVGDLLVSGSGNEPIATGETPNLAARLQELAPANGIVVSRNTQALTSGLFDCVSLGERQFKGFTAPLAAFEVVRERPTESRFDAVRADRLASFVGREQEVELILERWQEAKAGEGQVVLLSGEAGIGKSRITQTFRERIATEPHTRLSYQCSPYYTSTAFYPFITQLERAAGFALKDTANAKLDKIEAMVVTGGDDAKVTTSLFATLLSVPTVDRYPPLEMPVQQLKARTIAALTEQLVRLAARQPVLFIFEDAHWADPTSLEVLDQALARLRSLRVLALIIARPEFENRWAQHAHVTSLALNRLSRVQSGALVEGVTASKTLPQEVLDQIIAKTDGVPLFVEELTRTVLESGLLADKGDRYELTGPLPPLAIPATLQDSLMARLDRLDAVKELAQIGAAIGREFPHQLLASVAPLRGAELDSGLARLVASGLVFRQGSGEAARYVFKHALVQDAAYGSLLRSRRQVLHQKIASALSEHFPETVETTPETLAHHYTEAGVSDEAIKYWGKAGEEAARRSANLEAISHLTRALALLMEQPASEMRDKAELVLRTSLMPALVTVKGMASSENKANVARAAALVEGRSDISEHFPVLWGHWMVTATRGDLAEGLRIAERYVQIAERLDDRLLKMLAYRALGVSKLWLGRFGEGREYLERADALYDPVEDSRLRFVLGYDMRVSFYSYFGIDELIRGRPEAGRRFVSRSVELARSLEHVGSYSYALANTLVPMALQPTDLLESHGHELLDLATKNDLKQWVAAAQIVVAAAYAKRGRHADAAPLFEEGWQALKATRLKANGTTFLAAIAEWHCENGAVSEGFKYLREAQDIVTSGGERFCEAELLRIQGKLLHLNGDDAGAENSLHEAIAIARTQDAKSFELRAARDLATIWREQGKVSEARELLAPIYGWFTEGCDTDDLKSAKALLDELQEQPS